jgi:predicted O-methyltransferase YrrM
VLPLGLYLLSFILAFDHPRWYPRRAMRALAFPALFLMAFYASEQQQLVSIWKTIPIYCACFFLVCFVGNGELARLKPPKAGLTRFYLMIAAGGSLGSLLVGVAAPLLFPAAYELLLILIAFAILLPIVMKRSAAGGSSTSRTRIAVAAAAGVASVFAGFVLIQRIQMVGESHRAVRSFYGTLQVLDEGKGEDRYRSLIDGVIDHGCQFTAPSRQDQLTTYFGPGSGAALAFAALGDRPRRVGIVGLGAGTLAAYGRPGDRFDFFELNPDVVDIARRDFTFLARSRAEIQVRIGDGRLLLERLPDQNYDLIVLDAFSSDAVPVHLLTREAFASYGRHLRKGGLLCDNISNRYLDLRPVLHGVAAAQGKSAWVVRSEGDLSLRRASAVFVLMTDAAGRSALAQAGSPLPETSPRQPWTDDHTNLFPLLKVFAPNQSVNKP